MSKLIRILGLILLASCSLSGRSNDDGVTKYITGAAKIEEVKGVYVINLFRAIGSPDSSNVIGKYKYYRWDYSKTVGVSTLLGGGSTTFYCKLSTETQNDKIKSLSWYGNQCDIFLDQINEYFKNKLDIVIIADEDIKHQVVMPKTETKPEIKSEIKIEEPKQLDDVNIKANPQPSL